MHALDQIQLDAKKLVLRPGTYLACLDVKATVLRTLFCEEGSFFLPELVEVILIAASASEVKTI